MRYCWSRKSCQTFCQWFYKNPICWWVRKDIAKRPIYRFYYGWYNAGKMLWLPRWRVVSVKTIGRQMDFLGDFSAEYIIFCVILLNKISTSFMRIKISEKLFLLFLCYEKYESFIIFKKWSQKKNKFILNIPES